MLSSLKSDETVTYVRPYFSYIRLPLDYATNNGLLKPKNYFEGWTSSNVFIRIILKRCHLQPASYLKRLRYWTLDTFKFRRIFIDLCTTSKIVNGLTAINGNLFNHSFRSNTPSISFICENIWIFQPILSMLSTC